MKIAVIGTGYVGLVSAVCFAKIGHQVIGIDKIAEKISKLQNNEIPIFEPNLKEALEEVVAQKRISFTTDLAEGIKDAKAIFIAVGTPQDEDGSADLSYVLQACKEIAKFSLEPKLIVTKSTVPAKTGEKIKKLLKDVRADLKFLVASNPEFLREGCALDDFMNPDRIVIGCDDEESKKILSDIYDFFPASKIYYTDIITAELIKYASNSFLATKIAFINEMANLCEKLGANITDLSKAMGQDTRIGEKFLNVGPGFGGSCFPKDIIALVSIANQTNLKLSIVETVIESNKNRIILMVNKIKNALANILSGKKIALLGLAFKANTDDIRYSPAILIAKELLKQNAIISAHDYQAITNSQNALKDFKNIKFYQDPIDAIKDCDLIIIATEWQEYCYLDFDKIKKITNCRKIVDLRNIFNSSDIEKHGFSYHCIGKQINFDQ
ncbi:UDP-glucose 6-dehydrogenase [Alphaproteobacteria bacterium]|nr:UDP-glucose 6-dehydrogenase [Alphaproteobacteria bacterium]